MCIGSMTARCRRAGGVGQRPAAILLCFSNMFLEYVFQIEYAAVHGMQPQLSPVGSLPGRAMPITASARSSHSCCTPAGNHQHRQESIRLAAWVSAGWQSKQAMLSQNSSQSAITRSLMHKARGNMQLQQPLWQVSARNLHKCYMSCCWLPRALCINRLVMTLACTFALLPHCGPHLH
jgi:hypothetical protein